MFNDWEAAGLLPRDRPMSPKVLLIDDPSWSFLGVTAWLAGLLGLILLQGVPVAPIIVFRPIRDCPYFVSGFQRVFPIPD